LKTRIGSTVLLVAAMGVATAVAAEDPAFRTFGLAEELLREGREEQALEAFTKIVEGFPASALADDALFQMARRSFTPESPDDLGRADAQGAQAARPLLERILRDYPEGDRAADAGYVLGLIRMVPGSPTYQLDEAFAAFRGVATVHPDAVAVPAALRGSALAEMGMGRPGRGLIYLERVLLEAPTGALADRARLNASDAYLRLGMPREALVALRPLRLPGADPACAAAALDQMTLLLRLHAPAPGPEARFRSDPDYPTEVLDLEQSSAMAYDAEGVLHLLASSGKSVTRLSQDGRLLGRQEIDGGRSLYRGTGGRVGWASEEAIHPGAGAATPVVSDELRGIVAVAEVPDGSFFVLGGGGKELLHFGPDGSSLGRVAELERGVDLETDRRGYVHVLDDRARTVTSYLSDGTRLRVVGPVGDGFDLGSPVDIAVDDGFHLFVLDGKTHEVLAFDGQGGLIARIHPERQGPVSVRDARALAVDPAGAVFVFDGRSRQVRRFH